MGLCPCLRITYATGAFIRCEEYHASLPVRRDHLPRVTTAVLTQHDDEVWFVAFSHDGRFLATASKDCTAIVWRLVASEEGKAAEGEEAEVASATTTTTTVAAADSEMDTSPATMTTTATTTTTTTSASARDAESATGRQWNWEAYEGQK